MWWIAMALLSILAAAAALVYYAYSVLPEDDRLFPFDE